MTWRSGGDSRTSTPAWRRVRRQARTDLEYQCAGCGADGQDVRLELDHVVPAAEGGADDIDNAQWLCEACHKPKTQAEAKRGQARQPSRPRRRRPRPHPSDALLG
ncbi:MAG: HNH endonuclease [Mycobacterium sp.]|nr:MAG: HNH endonuclease [Mycobacterium sp.]